MRRRSKNSSQMDLEVQYLKWLANIVVDKKKKGKWRVYIDFTNLNKACPKDPFPPPYIDLTIDAIVDYEMLSFMDTYSSYNQIHMHPNDQEKTTFITKGGFTAIK